MASSPRSVERPRPREPRSARAPPTARPPPSRGVPRLARGRSGLRRDADQGRATSSSASVGPGVLERADAGERLARPYSSRLEVRRRARRHRRRPARLGEVPTAPRPRRRGLQLGEPDEQGPRAAPRSARYGSIPRRGRRPRSSSISFASPAPDEEEFDRARSSSRLRIRPKSPVRRSIFLGLRRSPRPHRRASGLEDGPWPACLRPRPPPREGGDAAPASMPAAGDAGSPRAAGR